MARLCLSRDIRLNSWTSACLAPVASVNQRPPELQPIQPVKAMHNTAILMRIFALLASILLCQCKSVAAPGDDKRWQTAYSYTQAQVAEEQSSSTLTWSQKAEEILIQALSLTGIDYKYGGRSPETGFDCSGFVGYVFKHAAQISLPPSARTISEMGKAVKREDLQPGDLVFFNTLRATFSHVGIYLGNNQFIHAPRAGSKVRIENLDDRYWKTRYNGAKRLEVEAAAATAQ